jgi:hypothetical protein
LTVFEIFFADGLEAGPSAKMGVLFFLEISVPSPLAKAVGKGCFSFFWKESCAESPWQWPSAKTVFYFFLKKFFAERPLQLHSAKLGTPELGKIFPELPSVFARALGKGPFADGPSRERGHTLFFSFHIDKQVHKSTKCLKSNETSLQHDQLSPRAYGECSCCGKGGTGDWRTFSPLGAW